MAKVLIACEESQRVCTAFWELGHEAYSCDIQEPSGGHPEWHILDDVLEVLNPHQISSMFYGIVFKTMDGEAHRIDGKWDLIIAHPPCTDLAVSGARHFENKRNNGNQEESIKFFLNFLNANCEHIAVENPIGIMSGGEYLEKYFPAYSKFVRKPEQIIQPYMFGDPHKKTTCLWLKGLPSLVPTDVVEPTLIQYKCKNGKTVTFDEFMVRNFDGNRGKARSKTFTGIAKAMAEQWGGIL